MTGNESTSRVGRRSFIRAAGGVGLLAATEVAGARTALSAQGEMPVAVPTFNCIGLYWKPAAGGADVACHVEYQPLARGRSLGRGDQWRRALPLWFDPHAHDGGAAVHSNEYRGSIVHLEPATTYLIRLTLEGVDASRTIQATTWDEEFPVAERVVLPSTTSQPVAISQGGSEQDGYVVYEPASRGVWDVADAHPYNLRIDASYVIVRGLTLRGAQAHGMVLGDAHHIVIEDTDISGWGRTKDNGQAVNHDSAIFSESSELEHIVIQACNLHHPRSDANSWSEQRPGSNSSHPEGPQAVTFQGSGKGRYVIRFNRIHSDIDHMFNDAMGNNSNTSYAGFPVRDSDVHDNFVSHCWDDALETEGGDMNVRVWNNYIDHSYVAFGAAGPSLGPIYFFRNVVGTSRKSDATGTEDDFRGQNFLKLGQREPKWSRGKMYVFHNTTLQPPPWAGSSAPSSGMQVGFNVTSTNRHAENVTSRNNILQMRSNPPIGAQLPIRDPLRAPSNDFDYDLYNGGIVAVAGTEANGIEATPIYERAPDGRLWLAPGTPGQGVGVRIPNFNDDHVDHPDIGAVETNSSTPKPPLWPTFPDPADPGSGGTNDSLASSATLAVDSTAGTNTKEKAVDGIKNSNASRWISANTPEPHWFELSWDSAKTINNVMVWSGSMSAAGWQIRDFTIQSWQEGSWADIPGTSVVDNTKDGFDGQFNDLTFDPVTTTKVRMWITDAVDEGDRTNTRLLEIEVWGS